MFFFLWILIQIIGESLPISSSGHVQLLQNYFHASLQNFENIHFLLHGPTIFILLFCFFSQWWNMIFLKNLFYFARFIIIADIITFIFWMLNLSKISFMQPYFLPIGFCITACCLYFSKYFNGHKKVSWQVFDAIILGIVQGICLLPGISRFATTFFAGLALGYDRKNAVAISFLIQFPLLCAAFFKELVQMSDLESFLSMPIIFTIVIASVISSALLCWVIKLIEQNRLWYFAFYMIIPISLSLFMLEGVML